MSVARFLKDWAIKSAPGALACQRRRSPRRTPALHNRALEIQSKHQASGCRRCGKPEHTVIPYTLLPAVVSSIFPAQFQLLPSCRRVMQQVRGLTGFQDALHSTNTVSNSCSVKNCKLIICPPATALVPTWPGSTWPGPPPRPSASAGGLGHPDFGSAATSVGPVRLPQVGACSGRALAGTGVWLR